MRFAPLAALAAPGGATRSQVPIEHSIANARNEHKPNRCSSNVCSIVIVIV